MRILYGVCDQGLGHASRTAPLIGELLKTNHLLILSSGPALDYLKTLFSGHERAEFQTYPEYPLILKGWGRSYFWHRFWFDLAALQVTFRRERAMTKVLVRTWRPDLIVSDSRYGLYHRRVPSFMINHHLRLLLPGWPAFMEKGALRLNARHLSKFDRIVVPDHPGGLLTGQLAQVPEVLSPDRFAFVGHLSALSLEGEGDKEVFSSLPRESKRIAYSPDILCVTGGYLLDQKNNFLERVRQELLDLDRPSVLVSGEPRAGRSVVLSKNVLEISFTQGRDLKELFLRASAFIGRSGHGTISDLAEFPKPSYLIPTPGQFEQAYLAQWLRDRGYIHSSRQGRMDLRTWWEKGPLNGWPRLPRTRENLPGYLAALGLD